MPKIAIVRGQGDAQHCVLRRFGVDEAEFTGGDGTGRVHVYSFNGSNFGGPAATQLWNAPDDDRRHVAVLLWLQAGACIGAPLE